MQVETGVCTAPSFILWASLHAKHRADGGRSGTAFPIAGGWLRCLRDHFWGGVSTYPQNNPNNWELYGTVTSARLHLSGGSSSSSCVSPCAQADLADVDRATPQLWCPLHRVTRPHSQDEPRHRGCGTGRGTQC